MVQGNVTVAVSALSYAGQFNVAVIADANAVPDLDVFAEALSQALTGMGAVPR